MTDSIAALCTSSYCRGLHAAEGSQLRQAVFAQLKAACTPLLKLRSDADGLSEKLSQVTAVVSAAPAAALQPCMEYALFPLLIIVDSIPFSRQTTGEVCQYQADYPPACKTEAVHANQ